MLTQLCAADQKPILKGPAYASRTLKGFVCEYPTVIGKKNSPEQLSVS